MSDDNKSTPASGEPQVPQQPAVPRQPYPAADQPPTAYPPAAPGAQQQYPGQPQQYPGQAQGFPGQPQQYPAQPQGFPGQPQQFTGAQQPVPGAPQTYPGAQQPYVAGPQYPAPAQATAPSPGSRRMLWIILGAIVAVIALIIGLIVWATTARAGAEKQAAADAKANAVLPVENYFDALAEGDAQKVLDQFADTTSVDKTFITDEVLAAANELGGVTDVSVKLTEVTDYAGMSNSATVMATYSVDGNTATTEFGVNVPQSGDAKISWGGTSNVSFSSTKVPFALNGVAATDERAEVVFGSYAITSANPNFSFGEGTTIAVTGDTRSLPDSVKAEITPEARTKVVDAVKPAVNSCLAETTLASSCGLDVPATLSDGTTVDENTVTRALSDPSALDNLDITVSYDRLGVEVTGFGSIDYTVHGTADGRSGTFSIIFGESLYRARVDLSEADPKVTLES